MMMMMMVMIMMMMADVSHQYDHADVGREEANHHSKLDLNTDLVISVHLGKVILGVKCYSRLSSVCMRK